jgi:GntR family transcriptional regulator
MNITLDHDSPIPLYHQIAEALRYRVATGRIKRGDTLPSVRDAAAEWGVNMHTVRRAYGELAGERLVETSGPKGTRVIGSLSHSRSRRKATSVDEFVDRVVRDAKHHHSLSPQELAHLITRWTGESQQPKPIVYVVECSETQCTDHAEEISAYWDVDARPWCLSRKDEPPDGPVVATYFHYNELRTRWPDRLHAIRFAAIHPDPKLISQVTSKLGKAKRSTFYVCEFEESKAANIAADLSVLFHSDRFRMLPRVVKRAGELLSQSKGRAPILHPPRVWDALNPEEKQNPRAIKVQYVFVLQELENMGQYFGWQRRPAARRSETTETFESKLVPSDTPFLST